MSTIQSLKNFIRHGKQARATTPHAKPTTDVSTVHAQQQRQPQTQYGGASGNLDAIDQRTTPPKDSGVTSPKKSNKPRTNDIEQIVAEEKRNKSALPEYPGLERWELLEKMGDGAFSNVYRARDTTGDLGEVAIKVVRKFEMNSKQRATILKEVQIMRQLDHPNIVRLYEFSESSQYYYIVLELCPGGELFHQIVRLTYFSEDLSRHVILQVAKAIEYLHESSGVVHRDIKPENLLFYPSPFTRSKNPKPPGPGDEDKVDEGEFIRDVGAGGIGKIKVADFGLSKVIWDSETMTPCGTVGYTAPEIVKDERYSKSVDMWALGCVMYTVLCGFPPFYDESIQALTEKVARGQYTFLSPWWDEISKPAQDLVSHLLTVDPDKRYSIKQFLDHPWIRQTDEETFAAEDAPCLATPQAAASNVLEIPTSADNRFADFRSPGAMNLREVFDVGYAVHRQEEEAKRRKNFRHGYRGNAGGFTAALNPLDEDGDDEYDEDNDINVDREDYADGDFTQQDNNPTAVPSKVPRAGYGPADVTVMENKMRSTTLDHNSVQGRNVAASDRQPHHQTKSKPKRHQQGGYGQHSAAVAAAARESVARSAQQPFELSLANATLLGRRERRIATGQPQPISNVPVI